jgi:hypothetical protein
MKELRRVALHVVLVVVAAGLAIWKSRPEDPSARALEPDEVKMWGGTPKDVTKVVFEGTRKKVTIERKKDAAGDWFMGTEEAVANAAPEPEDAGPPNPHEDPPPDPKAQPGTFVSVSVAEKLLEAAAPLIAKRRIGEVGDDMLKDYGLDAPKGTLFIDVAGKTQELVIGGPTPNPAQTYVRWKADNMVYVIDAALARDLESGKGRLSERQQHSWKPADAQKAVITAGDHRYEVIKSGTEGRQFWAQSASPDVNDETAGNWLKKVERLKPIAYVEKLPEGAEKIFRVEFHDKKASIGFLELYTFKAEKREWYIMTENLRLPATVAASIGDEARDDLDSLFPGAGYSQQHADEKDDTKPAPPPGHGDDPHAPPTPPEGKDEGKDDAKGKGDGKGEGEGKGKGEGKGEGKGDGKGAPKDAPKPPPAPKPPAP